ncbi:hypothetical protein D039_3910B, partial [Vibrio parahaemolyticus EKP-028]|jgi:hypothetical protein
LSR